jgi:hypothetical protein
MQTKSLDLKSKVLDLLQLLDPKSGHVNCTVGGQGGVSLPQYSE